jgi:hypothetical protein
MATAATPFTTRTLPGQSPRGDRRPHGPKDPLALGRLAWSEPGCANAVPGCSGPRTPILNPGTVPELRFAVCWCSSRNALGRCSAPTTLIKSSTSKKTELTANSGTPDRRLLSWPQHAATRSATTLYRFAPERRPNASPYTGWPPPRRPTLDPKSSEESNAGMRSETAVRSDSRKQPRSKETMDERFRRSTPV